MCGIYSPELQQTLPTWWKRIFVYCFLWFLCKILCVVQFRRMKNFNIPCYCSHLYKTFPLFLPFRIRWFQAHTFHLRIFHPECISIRRALYAHDCCHRFVAFVVHSARSILHFTSRNTCFMSCNTSCCRISVSTPFSVSHILHTHYNVHRQLNRSVKEYARPSELCFVYWTEINLSKIMATAMKSKHQNDSTAKCFVAIRNVCFYSHKRFSFSCRLVTVHTHQR